jgi:hypothetical protein
MNMFANCCWPTSGWSSCSCVNSISAAFFFLFGRRGWGSPENTKLFNNKSKFRNGKSCPTLKDLLIWHRNRRRRVVRCFSRRQNRRQCLFLWLKVYTWFESRRLWPIASVSVYAKRQSQ